MRNVSACLLLLVSLPAFASEKKELAEQYKGKYLVVLREGLVVGVCSHVKAPADIDVRTTDVGVQYSAPGLDKFRKNPENPFPSSVGTPYCGASVPVPLQKGEVLKVNRTGFFRGFFLFVQNASPHSMTRGFGDHKHETEEVGTAIFRFKGGDKNDYVATEELIEKWMKLFDTQEEAAKFGNTVHEARVK